MRPLVGRLWARKIKGRNETEAGSLDALPLLKAPQAVLRAAAQAEQVMGTGAQIRAALGGIF